MFVIGVVPVADLSSRDPAAFRRVYQKRACAVLRFPIQFDCSLHLTAFAFIDDDESGLHHDFHTWLQEIAPHEPVGHYRHNDTGKDNADANVKRQIMRREVVIAVT